jgi:hypothetical protein
VAKKDPEKYPVLLGPTGEDGRQEVLTFTPDGIQRGTLGAVGEGREDEAAATVKIEQQAGPLGTMEVIEGSICKGPAKVNSPQYRENWTSIFGAKQEIGEA